MARGGMMGKFDYVWVRFTPEEWTLVSKPVRGRRWGTFQRLLADILQRTDRTTYMVQLSPQTVILCRRQATYDGGGGYEDRYAAIVAATDRAVQNALAVKTPGGAANGSRSRMA